MTQQLACMQIHVGFFSAGTLHERYTYQQKLQLIASVDKDRDM